jgi:hypothetical protein
MRIPIWAHDANPSVDPRLLKKSLSHCESEVLAGLLRWLDPRDKSKGCFAVGRYRSASTFSREHLIAAGGMSDAWMQIQSGYAGPMVLQMPTEREERPHGC